MPARSKLVRDRQSGKGPQHSSACHLKEARVEADSFHRLTGNVQKSQSAREHDGVPGRKLPDRMKPWNNLQLESLTHDLAPTLLIVDQSEPG